MKLLAMLLAASAALLFVDGIDATNTTNTTCPFGPDPKEYVTWIKYDPKDPGYFARRTGNCTRCPLPWFISQDCYDAVRDMHPRHPVLRQPWVQLWELMMVNDDLENQVPPRFCLAQVDWFRCQAEFLCYILCPKHPLTAEYELGHRRILHHLMTNPNCDHIRLNFSLKHSYCEYLNGTRPWLETPIVPDNPDEKEETFTTTTQAAITETLATTTNFTSDYMDLTAKESAPIEPKRTTNYSTERQYWFYYACFVVLLFVLVIIVQLILCIKKNVQKYRQIREEMEMVDLSSGDRV